MALLLLHPGSPRDEEARQQLLAALDGAELGDVDPDTGIFEVAVDADDQDEALQEVFDAIAAAGADDHLALAEHPELPEHWRHRAQRPEVG